MTQKHRILPHFRPQDITRFWSKVDKTPGQGPQGECWLWTGCKPKGYGIFQQARRQYRANRIAFYLTRGRDPGDLLVCHSCDYPPCCRPEHLFIDTGKGNTQDAVQKGRMTGPRLLTPQSVKEILQLHLTGRFTAADLAVQFGTSTPTISRLIRGEAYRDIPEIAALSTDPLPRRLIKRLTHSPELRSQLRSEYKAGINLTELSRRHAMPRTTVFEIVKGRLADRDEY
jgi:hypothetical protein